MKSFILASAALLLATAAQAQTPPPPVASPDRGPAAVAPGGSSPQETRRHVERDRDRDRDRPHHRPGSGDRPGGERVGHFRFERGDLEIDVRCPGDEPLKACVDATMQLIDKFATVR